MIEVEQKYVVDDVPELLSRLRELDVSEAGQTEQHADTYYNHPSRDFAQTKEALRVRRINGVAFMTYKGTVLPGNVKARREIELRVGQTDADGEAFESALELLGFHRVATVEKQRRTFTVEPATGPTITIALDAIADGGNYAELEIVVSDETDVAAARAAILAFASKLGLQEAESRSYLALQLKKYAQHPALTISGSLNNN